MFYRHPRAANKKEEKNITYIWYISIPLFVCVFRLVETNKLSHQTLFVRQLPLYNSSARIFIRKHTRIQKNYISRILSSIPKLTKGEIAPFFIYQNDIYDNFCRLKNINFKCRFQNACTLKTLTKFKNE